MEPEPAVRGVQLDLRRHREPSGDRLHLPGAGERPTQLLLPLDDAGTDTTNYINVATFNLNLLK